jgi:hypothetical protein
MEFLAQSESVRQEERLEQEERQRQRLEFEKTSALARTLHWTKPCELPNRPRMRERRWRV